MLETYLWSILRSLRRDKYHSALNIFGLAVALAAALLIALYVQFEFSYDTFFAKPDRVYRLETIFQGFDRPAMRSGYTPYIAADTLSAAFPAALTATRLTGRTMVVSVGDVPFRKSVTFAEGNLFDVLDFPVAEGDAAAALHDSNSVILTQSTAMQLFGTESAIGKSLRLGDSDVRVGAILRDLPANSIFDFAILAPQSSRANAMPEQMKHIWGFITQETFLRLKDTTSADGIASQLPAFVERHVPKGPNERVPLQLTMRPLTDIHLYAGDGPAVSSRNAVSAAAFTATATLLLLIASFNYVNLSTARALLRHKEVGMRKVMGASRLQLLAQFLGEAVATSAAAFFVAIALAAAALPLFAMLIDRHLTLAGLTTPGFIVFAVGLLVVVSLAAGAYPAFVLANFRPTELFHIQRRSTGGRGLFRQIMVGLQFSLTVLMLVVTTVVFSQVTFLKHIDLGFRKEGLLLVRASSGPASDPRAETLKTELDRSGRFVAVGGSSSTPVGEMELAGPLTQKADGITDAATISFLTADAGFFDVYGVKPVAGRLFSTKLASDATTSPVVLSESAVRPLGFASPRQAIGQPLFSGVGGRRKAYTVIGVVPDLKFFLARKPTRPMAYSYDPKMSDSVSVRIKRGDTAAALQRAKQIWALVYPDRPMNYQFFEDVFDAANLDDTRQSELFVVFTGLAIGVACLGLFGLASFVAVRRTREIAIRKVMGASTGGITRLLVWDFAKPVLLANLVAWPVAWILMRQWLNGFAYRVELSVWFFLGAGAMALLIALATVIGQTLRAARTRPAEALAYE